MHIVGCDVNTRYIAMSAIIDGKFEESWLLPYKVPPSVKKNAQERLYDIADALHDWLVGYLSDHHIDWAYLEDVPMVRNVKTVKDLQAVVTATQLGFRAFGIPTTLVNVSTWKTETIGNAKASKGEIKEWAIAHTGIPSVGYIEDQYDATVIAFRGAVACGNAARI